MRNPLSLRLIGATVAVTILAAGCGGDAEEAHEPGPIELALTDYFADAENSTPIANRTEAECAAKEIVRLFGEDELSALGVTADHVPEIEDMGFDDQQVGWVLSGFNLCTDLTSAMQDSLAEDFGEEAAACVTDALGETVINEIVRAQFANDTAAIERTQEAFGIAAGVCGLS